MVRNAGKFGKAKRGGGRHFSRDLTRLDADGNSTRKPTSSDDEESSSSEEEESSSEEDVTSRVGQLPPTVESDESEGEVEEEGLNRNLNTTHLGNNAPNTTTTTNDLRRGHVKTADQVAQARKDKKASKSGNKPTTTTTKGSDDDDDQDDLLDLVNSNQKPTKSIKLNELNNQPKEISRREREQADKKAAAERYAKLHAAGKTDAAKSDLARLAEIRKQREQAAARRKAETDALEINRQAAMEKSGRKGLKK